MDSLHLGAGRRGFISIDRPEKRKLRKFTLYEDGNETTEYSGCTAELTLFNGFTSAKTYMGSVSNSMLTVTINNSAPSDSGLYIYELNLYKNIDEDSSSVVADSSSSASGDSSSSASSIDELFEGWIEIFFSRSKKDAKVFRTSYVKNTLDYYLVESNTSYLSTDDFKNRIIAEAYNDAVEEWNSHSDANAKTYTTISFPYESQVKEGVLGFALQHMAMALQRERMPAQSGGVSLDDKQRADFYLQQAQPLIARYRDWVAFKLERLNLLRGFGTI